MWSKILIETNAQIILKNSFPDNVELKNNIYKKFINQGVNEKQLIFLDREHNEKDHYIHYNKINLALDTFPFTGNNLN